MSHVFVMQQLWRYSYIIINSFNTELVNEGKCCFFCFFVFFVSLVLSHIIDICNSDHSNCATATPQPMRPDSTLHS